MAKKLVNKPRKPGKVIDTIEYMNDGKLRRATILAGDDPKNVLREYLKMLGWAKRNGVTIPPEEWKTL